jgi:hypothetical protein
MHDLKGTKRKSVVIIGLDPWLIDFASPDYAAFPGLTVEKVLADPAAGRGSVPRQSAARWLPLAGILAWPQLQSARNGLPRAVWDSGNPGFWRRFLFDLDGLGLAL